MALYDASGFAGDLSGWKSELGARIHDILNRRRIPVAERIAAIARKLESVVSTASLKSAISDLTQRFCREEAVPLDDDLALLRRQVAEHGKMTSIESYTSYLFTVEVGL
jgi:hypothetical protein